MNLGTSPFTLLGVIGRTFDAWWHDDEDHILRAFQRTEAQRIWLRAWLAAREDTWAGVLAQAPRFGDEGARAVRDAVSLARQATSLGAENLPTNEYAALQDGRAGDG